MSNHTHYVTHVDILGFSALVSRDALLAWEVLSSLASVRDYVRNIELEFADTGEQARIPDRIHSVMFSDTIVLFTKSDTLLDLRLIVLATTELLHKAMFACVPVRAGIAHGTFFFNIAESMYAGPALVEAYTIGEQAQWLGIVTTQHVYEHAILANMKSGTSDVVIPASIPINEGTRSGYAVNWPAVFAHDFKVKPPIPSELFYSGFARRFGPYNILPPRVRAKYENTVAYINRILVPQA